MQRRLVNRFTIFSKAVLSGLLVAWILAAAFISSGHHLHDLIHHESAQTTHDCAISLFERGETIGSASLCRMEIKIDELIAFAVAPSAERFSPVRFSVNATRGPPV